MHRPQLRLAPRLTVIRPRPGPPAAADRLPMYPVRCALCGRPAAETVNGRGVCDHCCRDAAMHLAAVR